MERLGINDEKEVDDVLKFYHDIGHLIYHQGCELIVLKPQFLNSIVSNIITVIDDKKMVRNCFCFTLCTKYSKREEGKKRDQKWRMRGGKTKRRNTRLEVLTCHTVLKETYMYVYIYIYAILYHIYVYKWTNTDSFLTNESCSLLPQFLMNY